MRFEKMERKDQIRLLGAIKFRLFKEGNNISKHPAFVFLGIDGGNMATYQRGTAFFTGPPGGATGAVLKNDGWYWCFGDETEADYKERLINKIRAQGYKSLINHIMGVAFTGIEYEYSIDREKLMVTLKVDYDNTNEIRKIMRYHFPAILGIEVVKI